MNGGAIQAVLLYGLWPLWLAAGVADWLCHRRTRIEATSGTREWAMHVVQAAQLGLALALALGAQITTAVLVALALIVLVHWATGYADTRYTHDRREISPFEQSVHAVLELAPVFAVVLLGLAHPEAFAAPDWRIVAKASPVPAARLIAFALVTVGVLLPLLVTEGLRCKAAGQR